MLFKDLRWSLVVKYFNKESSGILEASIATGSVGGCHSYIKCIEIQIVLD